MAAVAGYPIVRSREGQRGRIPLLEDPAFRAKCYALAGARVSRAGVANLLGFSRSRLTDWLSRGRANPHVEPYGSFARDYLAAERLPESLAVMVQARRLAYLAKLPPESLTPADLQFVDRYLASHYPEEHGTSAQHRKPDSEVTGAEWLEAHPLEHAQLVELLIDPTEAIEAAQREALDAMLMRHLGAGWRPAELTVEALRGVLVDQDAHPPR